MTLKKHAISGLVWTLVDTILTRGIGIVVSIVLARMLGPKVFGLMGMIYIFNSVATTLVDSGLTSSLIRTSNTSHKDYSTIFFTNICSSILIYALLFFSAPLIASFYKQSILTDIIRVYALLFVITSFSAVQITIAEKEMKFKKLMVLNIPGVIVGAALGVFMAYKDYGVWSIIYMQLVTQIVYSIMLWVLSDWKPTFYFSKTRLKIHFSFGYKLMLSSLVSAVFDNIYNVLIGKFYSVKSLGQFERAYMFNNYPVVILTSMIAKVTYPLLSTIQNKKEKITEVYRQILKFSFFVSAPLMLILAAVAHPLIISLLGNEWLETVKFFQILCFGSILYPLHAFNLNILKVFGRTDWVLKLEIIKRVVLVFVVAIAFQFGLYGLVWSSVFLSVLALVFNTYYTNRLIAYSLMEQCKDMFPTFLIASSMFLAMWFLRKPLENFHPLIQVFSLSSFGAIFYIFVNYLLKTSSFMFLLNTIKKQ